MTKVKEEKVKRAVVGGVAIQAWGVELSEEGQLQPPVTKLCALIHLTHWAVAQPSLAYTPVAEHYWEVVVVLSLGAELSVCLHAAVQAGSLYSCLCATVAASIRVLRELVAVCHCCV